MNKLASVVALAAVTTAATWVVQRFLAAASRAGGPPKPIEDWENEGGALAPQHAPVETSQVPR